MIIHTPLDGDYKYDAEKYHVYLAGTSDAENWQDDFILKAKDIEPLLIFNPYHLIGVSEEHYKHLIEWERSNIENADLMFFNFETNYESALSFLMLGEYGDKSNTVVCCLDHLIDYNTIKAYCEANDIMLVTDKTLAYSIVINSIPIDS